MLLKKHFDVQVGAGADFVICSLFSQPPFDYCAFEGVRIFLSGENFSPDFNLFDYCIGFDHLQYGDRYLRFPLWLYNGVMPLETQHLQKLGPDILQQKDLFCNFIYGHESEGRARETMLEKLGAYKHVDSPGRFANNMPGGYVADNYAGEGYSPKLAFQNRCKFSIAFESTSQPGFVTEKLTHAFEARTVPIYYGDVTVAETFNPKAFVNCHDFEDFDAVVQRVKEIDENDALYLEMLNQPVFNEENYVSKKWDAMEAFLVAIFSQDISGARRRSLSYAPQRFNDALLEYSRMKATPEDVHSAGGFRAKLSRAKNKLFGG